MEIEFIAEPAYIIQSNKYHNTEPAKINDEQNDTFAYLFYQQIKRCVEPPFHFKSPEGIQANNLQLTTGKHSYTMFKSNVDKSSQIAHKQAQYKKKEDESVQGPTPEKDFPANKKSKELIKLKFNDK